MNIVFHHSFSIAAVSAVSAVAAFLAPTSADAVVFYLEDFDDVTLSDKPSPYLGGWFANELDPTSEPERASNTQVAFGEWANNSLNAAVVNVDGNNLLGVTSDSGFRGAAVALDPALFSGYSAGTFTLSFDLFIDDAASAGVADVRVWLGKDYDLTFSSGDAIRLNTLTGELESFGNAVTSLAAETTDISSGLQRTLDFNYDGESAVVLFFGHTEVGYPFPVGAYDNISVSTVPEPGAAALLGGLVSMGVVLLRRVRPSKCDSAE